MEYIYLRAKKSWYNICENECVEDFNPLLNKYRIKIRNRYPGLNYGHGYIYVDPSDIKFIWKDGTLYGEYKSKNSNGSFNIFPNEIVDSMNKIKKLVKDEPANVMLYLVKYADIIARDPRSWADTKVDREKVYKYINLQLDKLTTEQVLIYELNKSEIDKLIDDINKLRRR